MNIIDKTSIMILKTTISRIYLAGFAPFCHQIAIVMLIILISFSGEITAQEKWDQVADFEGTEIYEIDFVNRYTGFVAGGGSETESPSIFKTVDGGQYWMPVENNIEGYLFAMGFLNDTTGFISTTVGLDSYIYRTTDQGETWEKVFTMYLRTPAFSFVGDSNVFAMQTETDRAMTTKSIDCGESWEVSDVFSTEWGAIGVTDFQFLTENIGYMIFESGILYRTDDGGETFTEVFQDFQYDFISLHFLNTDTGYIAGEVKMTGEPGSNSGIVYKTTNGGTSWESMVMQGECTDVIFVNPDTGYLATTSGPLHTYNAGEDWQPSTTFPEGSIQEFCFPATHTGYAAGGRVSYDDLVYKNGVTFGTTINNPQKNSIQVYPNPTTHLLNISLQKEMKINDVAVYNMQGELLLQRDQFANPIDVYTLKPGSYIIEIHTKNAILKEKFLVR